MLSQAIGILLVALAARWIYRGHFHPLAECPGPFLARYTNLWCFVVYMRRQGHVVDEQLHAKYGPIVRTGPNSLSFSTLSAYHTIYTVDRVFEKGSFYDFARDPVTGQGSIFTARTAADIRDSRRRVLNGAFSGSSLISYKPVIARAASIFVRSIEDELHQQAQSCINLAPVIQTFVTNLNFELVHGLTLADLPAHSRAGALKGLQAISKFSFGFSYLPLLGYIVSSRAGRAVLRRPKLDPVTKEPQGFTALVARSTDAVWRRDGEIAAPDAQPSFLKAWLAVDKSDTAKYMDKDQIGKECMNLVFAGRGSTATAIILLLHTLGSEKGRPWQHKVHEELATQGGRQSMPPALAAVVKETLRLYPPFPRGFPREVGPGAEVVMPGMDRPLPSGTMVYSSAYIIARSPDVWGPDAAEWKPERWYKDTANGAPEGAGSELGSLEGSFLAFGKGARGCIGRDIAMMTILEAVGQVLERWEVRADGELCGVTDWEVRYDHCPATLIARAGGM